MYGLIGKKLGHSFSPQIHKKLADYEYKLFEMEENEVGDFMKNADFNGINVTIPYKKTVIPYIDRLSDDAKKIGSVNTVKRMPDNTLYGDNTDYYGFKYTLDNNKISPCGKKCIILGSGGASLTAISVLRDMCAKEITVISRTGENNYGNISKHFDAEIIVNTTPVGMYPNCGQAPISLADFTKCEFVFDLIYNPAKTALLLEAEKLGIPYSNGLTMLTAQAKKSSEIFTGNKIDESKIREITESLKKQTLNIVLVGMPGCGKSTLGKILADKLNRRFLDTDSVIEQKFGASIPEIFAQKGEDFFRELEESAVSECGCLSSCVIATGGGVILRQKNIDALRQNGIIIFLDRNIDELASDGRPLSQNPEKIKALYQKRFPIYKECADFEVKVNTAPDLLAEQIIQKLSI